MKGPRIFAVIHHSTHAGGATELSDSAEKVYKRMHEIGGDSQGGRVFLEGDADFLSYADSICELLGDSKSQVPFIAVVHAAKENRWEVVPLDKKIFRGLVTDGLPETQRYVDTNLRYRHWAQVLKRHNAGQGDIIVMFPNHVEGFLAETGMSEENVVWINRPRDVPSGYQRLSPDEVEAFRTNRGEAKKTRRRV